MHMTMALAADQRERKLLGNFTMRLHQARPCNKNYVESYLCNDYKLNYNKVVNIISATLKGEAVIWCTAIQGRLGKLAAKKGKRKD